MDKLVTIRKTDFGIRPGVYRETEIFQHIAHQQYLYMNGRDSTWGFQNHYAEYLLYGPRRLKHGR